MQFVYNEKSGNDILTIENDSFVHIFKARRTKVGEDIFFRNLEDNNIYRYQVLEINKKNAVCKLFDTKKDREKKLKEFNLAWCVVDTKIVEKTLPILNEIGVKRIFFVYSDFSQKNFKIDFEKLKKILIYSCEQCGRADFMEFKLFNSIKEFMEKYSDFGVVDFSSNRIDKLICKLPQTWMIGCEGGFSKSEKELLKNQKIVGFDTDNILKSESAAITIASKILL